MKIETYTGEKVWDIIWSGLIANKITTTEALGKKKVHLKIVSFPELQLTVIQPDRVESRPSVSFEGIVKRSDNNGTDNGTGNGTSNNREKT